MAPAAAVESLLMSRAVCTLWCVQEWRHPPPTAVPRHRGTGQEAGYRRDLALRSPAAGRHAVMGPAAGQSLAAEAPRAVGLRIGPPMYRRAAGGRSGGFPAAGLYTIEPIKPARFPPIATCLLMAALDHFSDWCRAQNPDHRAGQ